MPAWQRRTDAAFWRRAARGVASVSAPETVLPREHRLRAGTDFREAYRTGRGWSHPLLSLQLKRRSEGLRVGISAGKRVGGAVARNRVRRRLRAIVRAELPAWRNGFDAVFAARAPAADAAYPELAGAVRILARRARLIREPFSAPGTSSLVEGGPSHHSRNHPSHGADVSAA